MGLHPIQKPYRDQPDAVSLHSTPSASQYEDDDVPQTAPPAYTDDLPETSAGAALLAPRSTQRIEVSDSHTEFLGKPINVVNGVYNMLDARCDSEPDYLEQLTRNLATVPPNPMIHIVGTHRETIRRGNKKETNHIVDFKITLNMTDYLFPPRTNNPNSGIDSWRPPVRTVENGESALRGSFRSSRAPGYKADLEVGDAKPTLQEWCHRYCASGTYLKVFRLTRQVTGFDEALFKTRLDGIVRSTGYRGTTSITFPVQHQYVDFYSSNRVNQWRLTTWVRWIFYLTFLWLFTWPYLFFATKRYAVVTAEWPFSKVDAQGRKVYASISEEEWLQRYAVAVQQLALDRFQGDADGEYLGQVLSRPRNENTGGLGQIRTGNAGVDSAVNLFSGGLRAVRDVNRLLRFGDAGPQEGWGYDT